jgi:hypothetical protein
MNINHPTIAQVRALLDSAQLTRAAAARLLRMSRGSVHRWIRGEPFELSPIPWPCWFALLLYAAMLNSPDEETFVAATRKLIRQMELNVFRD